MGKILFFESQNSGYRERTFTNIIRSDVTFLFTVNANSSGSRLTATTVTKKGKLLIKVNLPEFELFNQDQRREMVNSHIVKIDKYLRKQKQCHVLTDHHKNMTFTMPDEYKLPYINSDNTLSAIKEGYRTATTRHGSEAKRWGNVNIGDTVTFYNGDDDFVNVMICSKNKAKNIPKKLWCFLEGWNAKYYDDIFVNKLGGDSLQFQYRLLPKTNRFIANIAGNGLSGRPQDQIYYDELIACYFDIYLSMNRLYNPYVFRSGMQTGADEAGLKYAINRGINAVGLSPKGWRFRNKDGVDIYDENASKKRFVR